MNFSNDHETLLGRHINTAADRGALAGPVGPGAQARLQSAAAGVASHEGGCSGAVSPGR